MEFQNGKPEFEYSEVHPCFRGTGNGLLFRMVQHGVERWAFYNDTPSFRMSIVYDFGEDSHEVRALGKTKLTRSSQSCSCRLMVEPLETALFVEGKPTRILNAEFNAIPLSG